jgi:hypothetical protein
MMTSLFNDLYYRNVNEHTQKNNGLTYLSWSYAWAEIKKIDPKAEYKLHEFPMMVGDDYRVVEGVTVPYLRTPQGYSVKVSVTVNGHTETETLPVMDNKNVPLGTIGPVWVKKEGAAKAVREFGKTPEPTSFDLNTAYKRCLVKAIALHGLGLYIYNGEDVPEVDTEKLEKDRQGFIQNIKHLASQDNRLAAKLSELEHLAKKPVEKFALPVAERAYGVLTEMMAKIENEDAEKAAAHA